MKANELMIGDWVFIKDYPMKALPKKVKPEHFVRSLVEFEPIPLTPEILEKNGFIIKKKWAQIGNFGNSPLIMWHFEDDTILHNFKNELEIHQNDTGKLHVKIPCEYVHELQHALKLCGIDKNIEL